MEEQYKSSFVRALAERWQFWRPMAVEKVGKLDRVPRMIIRSALDTFDIFNRMPEFLEKLDSDDRVRSMIEIEIKALAAAIEEAPMFVPSDDDTTGGTIKEEELPAIEEAEAEADMDRMEAERIEKPEPQYVQVLDPDTDRWQIVDRDTGEVTNRKKSPGPYKNIPTMEEVKDAGDGEAREQANTTDQAEDQQ
ncbi:unnamed protein product [marine sediment metagenome]|uniref:Uncharacterized protein n=1 Tax=marine sediment metagenome TaxID=412755 RepID=X0RPI9_9ZZZZ